jgi:hypothetical protein
MSYRFEASPLGTHPQGNPFDDKCPPLDSLDVRALDLATPIIMTAIRH